MRPSFVVFRHLLFASLTGTSRGLLGVQNDRSVLGINNEFSGVCYTYVSVYPVLADGPDYITITKPYRGSVTALYTVPPQGDEPGVVIVEQPGGSSAPENIVIPATDERSYVIIIRPYQGPNPISAPITQVVPPRNGQPGQIIIETPETQAADDATPGVLQPMTLEPHGTTGSYVTVIEPAGVSFTGKDPIRITVAPSGGKPGTVIIQTPVPGTLMPVALETLRFNTLGPLGRLIGKTITLQPADATGYVTIIEPAEGSVLPTAPIRTTIPPTGTKPGTVLIQTPPEGNGGRPGGAQATGAAGTAFPPSRTRPEGSVSYTTITRGVPLGLGGSDNDSGDGSSGGADGGSGDGQDGAGSNGGDGSGNAQDRPGQGQDDTAGPRETITIPPEGGNPGTVLVLTPEDPSNPRTDSDEDSDGFPVGSQPTGSNGDSDDDSTQATAGSNNGNQGGSGGGSNDNGSGTGSDSGNTSGLPGQGGGSSDGDSGSNDSGDGQGSVQGNGSGSAGDDEEGDSDNAGSSGSNGDNTSGNDGSSSSPEDNTLGGDGSGGSQDGSQGGSGTNNGQGGSGTGSGSSSGSTQGASNNDSGDNDEPIRVGTQSGGNGSDGDQDSEDGNSGGEGSTPSGGNGSQGEDNPGFDGSGGKNGGEQSGDGSEDGSEPISGGTASNGGGSDEDPDDTGGDAENASSKSSSKRTSRTAQSQSKTRKPIVTTSPATYTVTSSNTVITITADVVKTLTNDKPKGTRTNTSKWNTSTGWGTVKMGMHAWTTDAAGSTVWWPSSSGATKAATSAGADGGDSSSRVRPRPSRTTAVEVNPQGNGGSPGPPELESPTSSRTRVRPGSSNSPSTRRSKTSTTSQTDGSSNGETTILELGPVETNPAESVTQTSTASSGDGSQKPSSTRPGQGSATSKSTNSQRSTASGSATSTQRFTVLPQGLGTRTNGANTGATSRSTQRSAGDAESQSTSASNDNGNASQDDETATQRSATGSSSQSTGAGAVGTTISAGSSASASISEGGTSPDANTRAGGETFSQSTATGSSRASSSVSTSNAASGSGSEIAQSQSAGGVNSGTSSTLQAASRRTTTSSESINIETLVGSQSVAESDRVPQGDATSSTRQATSGASSGAASDGEQTTSSQASRTGAAGQPTTIGSGVSEDASSVGSSTTRQSDSQSTEADREGSQSRTSVGVTVLPAGGVGGSTTREGSSRTSGVQDGNASSTTSASDGEAVTDGRSGSASSGASLSASGQSSISDNGSTGDASSAVSDDNDSATGSQSSQNSAVTSTGASSVASQTGSSDENEDDDSETGTTGASRSNAQASETDAGAMSNSSDGGAPTGATGPGSSSSSNSNDDGEATTIVSAGDPIIAITADVGQTSDASDSEAATITVFKSGSGPDRTTLYIPPQASGDPWTVVIETPVSETQSEAATARGDDDELVTASAIGGNVNVTLFRAGDSDVRKTFYIPPNAAGQPGTIIIETPRSAAPTVAATTTAASIANPASTATSAVEDDEDVVSNTSLETSGVSPNITVYSSGTASSRITVYVPPTASDGPGYIIIETPVADDDSEETDSVGIGEPTAGSPAGIANVTVFTSGTATARQTVYLPPTASGEAGTIVIQTPVSEVDTETTGDTDNGRQTTTLESGIIPNVTVFSSGTASVRVTLYIPPTASGEAGTIVIQTPVSEADSGSITGGSGNQNPTSASDARSGVTIFTQGTASTRITKYISPTASGEPGTYIIETPASESGDDVEVSAGITSTVLPSGVIPNVTVYSGFGGSSTRTVYIPPTAPGEAGTLVIETPTSGADDNSDDDASETQSGIGAIVAGTTVTVFSGGPGSVTRTVYVPPTASGDAGTLYIETPTGGASVTADEDVIEAQTTVTIFSGGPASVTRTVYVPPTASGEPGTLYIETPTGGSGATATDEDEAISARTTVTVFSGGPGSVTKTVYVPPTAVDEPGTLYIETPTDGSQTTATDADEDAISAISTVTIFSGGSGSVTRTVYVPPASSGDAGTLYIETPTNAAGPSATGDGDGDEDEDTISAATTVTVFSGVSASVTRTVYIPPTASGEAGTLIIETPVDETAVTSTRSSDGNGDEDVISARTTVTIFSGGPASVTRTVYFPPTASGEAGTLIIQTPTGDSGASPTDDYAGESDNATESVSATDADDDVISATNTVTVYSGGPASVTRTVYIPPTASGEAGTLVIETPTGGSGASSTGDNDPTETDSTTDADAISARTTVTIFSGGSGSVTRTVYIPPTASGEAGTLVIETPTSDPDDDDSVITGTGAGGPTSVVTSGVVSNVTIYSGGPASSTTTRFIPATASGEPGTVVIETPTSGPQATGIGNITIVTGGPATVTQTRYIPATVTGEPGTIVVETPTSSVDDGGSGNTTIYSGVSAAGTRTIYIPPTASGEPGTIIIETPAVRADSDRDSTTVYSGGSGSVTRTIIISATATDEPDTVIIETPTSGTGAANVTIYSGVSATAATTRFIPGTASGDPGTLIIETPIDASQTGSPTYVTIFSGGPGTAVTTIYLTPSASGDSTTMIIQTPTQGGDQGTATDDESITSSVTGSQTADVSSAGNVTVFSGGPGTVRTTLFVPPTASGAPGTVIIQTPTSVPDVEASATAAVTGNVTIYSGGPGTATKTVYIPATVSGEVGTVVIETPTSGSDDDEDDSASETSADAAGTTIEPTVSGGNVTIINGGPASVTRTVYIPPTASGQPGTVIIETPTGSAEESATSETGTITVAPATSTVRPGNVTIYTQAPGTAGGTFYFPPDDPEESGTVIVETLPGDAEETGDESSVTRTAAGGRTNTTVFSGGPVTAPRTLYISATVSGEPDTVLVETPITGSQAETSGLGSGQTNTTVFSGGSGTVTRTVFIPATVSGEPDTVLIETPTGAAEDTGSVTGSPTGVSNVTISQGGPGSVATTIYVAGQSGQPGTVIIQTPTESVGDEDPAETGTGLANVTLSQGGPGSVATTIYIPGVSGQPGTVIIQTPTGSADDGEPTETGDGQNEITVTSGGPVSVATTITIPGISGQPDRVLVQTPTESGDGLSQVTITSGGSVSIATTITIPGVSGQPDTVLIETPTGTANGEEPTQTDGGPNEVTITRGGPVSVATTVTIQGISGQPDTVLIQTPTESADGEASETSDSQDDVTLISGGPVSVATTITIPGVSGQPDTVLIRTPTRSVEDEASATDDGQDDFTITRGGPVSAATTITIPGLSGQPDTVVIETPTAINGGQDDEVTITRGGPATVETTITIPGLSGQPDTVVIETPTGSADEGTSTVENGQGDVTITRGGPVSVATTITIPGVSGEPDTVLVETPTGIFETPNNALTNVTVYSGGPVTVTRTIYVPPAATSEAGTVIIETPDGSTASQTSGTPGNITIFTGIPGTATKTVFVPATVSGDPGTVYIQTPTGSIDPSATESIASNITVYSGGPGSATQTLYIPPTVSGEAGTIVIQTPTGGSADDQTDSAEITASNTGVIVSPQGRPNTTVYSGGPGSVATTIYVSATVSGEPDIIFIQTPTAGPEGDETDTDAISSTATSTLSVDEVQNVTITSGGPGTAIQTIYLPPASSGEAGTIVIQTPTGTSNEEEETTASASATATGTSSNVTITSGGSGSTTRTVYFPPASDDPGGVGTIVIETPTDSEPSSGSATETISGSIIANEKFPNVTIYSGGSASVTRTVYYPPRSDATNEPGTVVIETPTSGPDEPANVTRYIGGPASITTTIYIPPTASGEGGVVIIQTPTSGSDETPLSTELPADGQNTTIYSGGPGTVATTIYYPPASDDPDRVGTVIIQTPTAGSSGDGDDQTTASVTANETSAQVQNVTRIVGGPASVATTIYIPPTASGEPGTVLIETPTSSPEDITSASAIESTTSSESPSGLQNVTRFVGGPDSVTTTIYIPPATSGEPGTVLIQTPTNGPGSDDSSSAPISGAITATGSSTAVQNITQFVGGPASITTTIYIPPSESGEPGIVIIQTPTAEPTSEGTSSVPTSETVTSVEFPSTIPNITRYVEGPASVTTTIYIPPATSGEPGTVVIQTPSAAATSSEVTTSAEAPGTIQNITRFVGGPASITTTIYFPPAVSGDPGTVVIQTPTAAETTTSVESTSAIQNVTRYVGGPASVTTTIYIPPTASNEPGTVLIQTPTSAPEETTTAAVSSTSATPVVIQNVTRYVEGPASVTTTIYVPPASSGDPGTVLIQTPSAAPATTSSSVTTTPAVVQNVTIYAGGSGSVTVTMYRPPISEGGAGTVLIETPTAGPDTSTSPPAGVPSTSMPIVAIANVTVFVAAASAATTGRTLYNPPTAAGEPGTIIIETLAAVPPSTSSSAAAPVVSSSSPVVVVPPTTTSSAAVVIPTTSSAPVVVPPTTTSSVAVVVPATSSAPVVVPPTTTSSAAVVVPTTSSAAPVVITTSSAVVVVPTTSRAVSSTSMMPQAAFGPTFDCNGYGFVLSSLLSNTLTQVNLITGERVTIKSGVGPGGAINGIGFNPIDNYIYGFVTQPLLKNLVCGLLGCPQSQLIRIAKNGNYEVLPLVISSNSISMGDVDNQGRLWVSEGGGKWWSIDLRRGANFGKLISSGTSNIDLISGVGDWAYVPGGGDYLYAVQASVIESGLLRTNIVRWSLTTQKWERYQSYPNLLLTALNLIWGAVMAAPDGSLYAQENLLGQTWRFTLGSTANPTSIQGGAILNLSGDGAKCASGAV
jgi:hypothetical protein